jgi:hypothetical protein
MNETCLSGPVSKQVIIEFLLDGWGIKLKDNAGKNYWELISGGFANYSKGMMTKNWKTEYWQEPVPEPIEPIDSRFEILDL